MKKLLRTQNGQALTEYLILLILIAVVSIAATTSLGTTVRTKLQLAREKINAVSVGN